MLENYSHQASVGSSVLKSYMIFKLEQGEDPGMFEGKIPSDLCSDEYESDTWKTKEREKMEEENCFKII
ncbi:hypothetical protein J1605_014100 [Eschrichtius robustus]|uniref:KRAB domain-containing protein n=1 Tax=Eschrichtius robustus TaxID=9764 RepID=A0AB34GCX6_ESCRO|nr:hypothetical protein J1605_014100 [Eschrichtius robustus]